MTESPTTPESTQTPAQRGYRMPAEWENHAATWLSWPRREGVSFPGKGAYDKAMPALAKMVHALADSEPVHINVCDAAHEADVKRILSRAAAKTSHVTFHQIPINEPWCRDHGPIFVTRSEAPKLLALDWDYNAWGCKYPPFDDDDYVPTAIAEKFGLPVEYPGMILEGGSIDVNGKGLVLTTRSCLLNPNRNPELSQQDIEQRLRDWLGIREVLWLGDGIEGDDTDGHIDDIARFTDPNTIVACVEKDESDPNHKPLRENLEALKAMKNAAGKQYNVVELPMPERLDADDGRLPASYANFYIANKVVLLPVFGGRTDKKAEALMKSLFPGR